MSYLFYEKPYPISTAKGKRTNRKATIASCGMAVGIEIFTIKRK